MIQTIWAEEMRPDPSIIFADVNIETISIRNLVVSLISRKHKKSIQGSHANPLFGILLYLSLITGNGSAQTTIVVRKVPGEIVVAADSKGAVNNSGTTTNIIQCKIRPINQYFFAASGLVQSKDGSVDLYKVATEESSTGNMAEVATRFWLKVTPPIEAYYQRLKSADPKRFRKALNMLEVKTVFFGIEQERPVAAVLAFKITQSRLGKVTAKPIWIRCNKAQESRTLILGFSNYAWALEGTRGFWGHGSISGAQRLVQREIEKDSRDVGGPIDILRVTKDGPCWKPSKAECAVHIRTCE